MSPGAQEGECAHLNVFLFFMKKTNSSTGSFLSQGDGEEEDLGPGGRIGRRGCARVAGPPTSGAGRLTGRTQAWARQGHGGDSWGARTCCDIGNLDDVRRRPCTQNDGLAFVGISLGLGRSGLARGGGKLLNPVISVFRGSRLSITTIIVVMDK